MCHWGKATAKTLEKDPPNPWSAQSRAVLLSTAQENWVKLTGIDRAFAAMAQMVAFRHNYGVSKYQLLPEAGWGSLAANLARGLRNRTTMTCSHHVISIHYTHYIREAAWAAACRGIYSIIAHIIVSTIPWRIHMTWCNVWRLFFTAFIRLWLGLGFARMLCLHVFYYVGIIWATSEKLCFTLVLDWSWVILVEKTIPAPKNHTLLQYINIYILSIFQLFCESFDRYT